MANGNTPGCIGQEVVYNPCGSGIQEHRHYISYQTIIESLVLLGQDIAVLCGHSMTWHCVAEYKYIYRQLLTLQFIGLYLQISSFF